MFSRLSQPGIVLENIRSLSFGLTVASLVAPLFQAEIALMAIGILMGTYYGYRIERDTYQFRTLGGRLLKGKNWDYLILS